MVQTNAASQMPGQIKSIQALRAMAALFVVLFHSTVLWYDRSNLPVLWENGNAGVDLFFVISGFIMVYASERLRSRNDAWRVFIKARFIRVVPLYWLATAAKIVSVIMVPSLAVHTAITPWNCLASFLFIPSTDGVGIVRPVIAVGWTLSFEMMFYIAFAAALFLMADAMVVVAPVMLGLALVHVLQNAAWSTVTTLADPIVLEFVLGMVVGRLALRGSLGRVAPWAGMALVVVGLTCLVLVNGEGVWRRVLVWGTAATAVLSGALIAERVWGRYIPGWLVLVGEASYSLYLTHTFVLPFVGAVLAKTGLRGYEFGIVLVPACTILSVIVAVATFLWVEAPMTRRLRNCLPRTPAPLDLPTAPL